MPLPMPYLVARSRELLGWNQKVLAQRLGSSERTVQRWESARSTPSANKIHALSDAVRPRDAAIADDLDVWAPRSIVAPPPAAAHRPPPAPVGAPPAPAPSARIPSGVPAHAMVDSIVCAAAEAMSLPPQAIRPALLAAFSRAEEVGITVDEVLGVLAPALEVDLGEGAKGPGAT